MVSEQLHYTTNREEIFIFSNKKMSYLCGVWRFANAYKMYRLARSITGYTSGDSYGSGSPSVGSMRDYIMEKIKSPSITLEIGVIGCPLPTSQFASIWGKNHALVLREAKLLL